MIVAIIERAASDKLGMLRARPTSSVKSGPYPVRLMLVTSGSSPLSTSAALTKFDLAYAAVTARTSQSTPIEL